MNICEIKNICDNHYQCFLDKKNVVGICIGEKFIGGMNTGNLCLMVMVSKKECLENLDISDHIPSDYHGIVTDVVETGTIMAQALTTKVRPVLMGYSIGPRNLTLAGTAGALVTDGNSNYILSNNHVMAGENTLPIGTSILQPGRLDGGNPTTDGVANLTRYAAINFESATRSPVNYIDAAIAKVINTSNVSKSIALIGNVAGTATAAVNMQVKKAGRTSSLTTGVVTGISATVRVGYSGGKTAVFKNQIVTSAMSSAGDSGSLVLTQNNKAIGLLFAGSSTVTVLNPISLVLSALRVSLVL